MCGIHGVRVLRSDYVPDYFTLAVVSLANFTMRTHNILVVCVPSTEWKKKIITILISIILCAMCAIKRIRYSVPRHNLAMSRVRIRILKS